MNKYTILELDFQKSGWRLLWQFEKYDMTEMTS